MWENILAPCQSHTPGLPGWVSHIHMLLTSKWVTSIWTRAVLTQSWLGRHKNTDSFCCWQDFHFPAACFLTSFHTSTLSPTVCYHAGNVISCSSPGQACADSIVTVLLQHVCLTVGQPLPMSRLCPGCTPLPQSLYEPRTSPTIQYWISTQHCVVVI